MQGFLHAKSVSQVELSCTLLNFNKIQHIDKQQGISYQHCKFCAAVV